MKKCGDVMTIDPFCCLPGDSVVKVAQSMKDLNVGSIPVVENENSEKLIGIITDRDITLNVVACNLSPSETRVQDAMSRDLIVCRPEEPVTEAINAMAAHQVRRIPVVDEENKIVGIISQGDVALRLNDPETTGDVVAEISEQG
jgi:CBS domain-containing protein